MSGFHLAATIASKTVPASVNIDGESPSKPSSLIRADRRQCPYFSESTGFTF